MRISVKAQYAVSAALDLAMHSAAERGLRSAGIAQRTGVPEKFLEAILRDLREAGLVASKRGPDGGHRLVSDPSIVTVAAVVEAIDGPYSITPAQRGPQSSEQACVSSLWRKVERAALDVLAGVTLEDLKQEASAPGPLDFTI
jgi:Rrf2 family protein